MIESNLRHPTKRERKVRKQSEAVERAQDRKERSDKDQLKRLDQMSEPAKKERARLQSRIEKKK